MASKTSICNQALKRLGQPAITDIDEGTVRADSLKAIFNDVRDFVLACHPWNFATKRAALALLSETPVWQWDYYYQLPTDCIRVVQLDEWEDESLWEVEAEGRLATNESTAYITYIARVDEAGKFSPGFVQALAARLAAEVAFEVTGRPDTAKMMLELWPLELAKAVALDSQEKGPQVIICNTWVNARL